MLRPPSAFISRKGKGKGLGAGRLNYAVAGILYVVCLVCDLLRVTFDVSDSIANRGDLFGLIVGNGDTELLLKFHNELYRHQGR